MLLGKPHHFAAKFGGEKVVVSMRAVVDEDGAVSGFKGCVVIGDGVEEVKGTSVGYLADLIT
ncbi:hypothetical protein HK101_008439, partial [Irineochytrium annulatum]